MAPRGQGLLLAVVLTAIVGFLATAPTSAAPPPFDPGGVMCFELLESAANCDGDATPGAPADLRLTFCTGWDANCTGRDNPVADSSLAGMVMFTPAGWNVPKGDTIPNGSIAGRIDEEKTLGLLSNPCNSLAHVSWTLLNGSVKVNDTIVPRPEGETDVMKPLAMDTNGNGIPDGADRYPKFLADYYANGGTPVQPRARLFGITNIQGSWVTQNILFFEPGTTLEIGQTAVTLDPALGYPAVVVTQDPVAQDAPAAITDSCAPEHLELVVLGKTLDNPCTPAAVQGANCPVTSDVGPEIRERGYPSMPCDARSFADDDGDGKVNDGCPLFGATPETGAECDNDVSDEPEDSSINDGCPAVGDINEGARIPGSCTGADEGGCTNRANPIGAGGPQTFTVLAVSERDADGDGIENGLDVCFDKPNPEWNPRGMDVVNDPDMDGLPSACDPSPNSAAPGSPAGCASGYTGSDQDQDCFSNRADNCPLKPSLQNPTKPPDAATNKPFAPDDDGDGIGNACDPDPNAVNGEFIGYCLKFATNVGGASGPVVGVRDSVPAPECAINTGPEPTPTLLPTPTPVLGQVFLNCTLNAPATGPMATPTELPTVTSDVTAYATLSGFTSTVGQTITFSDEPGLGAVDPTTFTVGADGIAKTTYRLPVGLTGMAVATVTATTAGGKTCSVSFVVKPGITALPPTGGSNDDEAAGVLAALAVGVIALGGGAALVFAGRKRA